LSQFTLTVQVPVVQMFTHSIFIAVKEVRPVNYFK